MGESCRVGDASYLESVASSWGRLGLLVVAIASVAFATPGSGEAIAGASSPFDPVAPDDPLAVSQTVSQSSMVHIFDTDGLAPFYVNDHTLIQEKKTGRWHLFGIYHPEPFGPEDEYDFVHAVAAEPDPARWTKGAFTTVASPHAIALHADRAIGETHIWAPHVVEAEGRYWMIYQGGGVDGDRASIRIAESFDLYEWKRSSPLPLFEDICVARDPMLVRRENAWALYYTRCDSLSRRVSGVAYRLSKDLAHWGEPHMVLTLTKETAMVNSGFTESPFVFERNGYWYLSVSSYPISWDATMVYRSPAPFAFPNVPYTRLRAHAGEWVSSANGKHLFVTHAGAGQRGVWLSQIQGL